jgi:hypothetical protein
MKTVFTAGLLSLALSLLAPARSFAGILAPEIDPSSAAGGLALVVSGSALILERRRRR